MIKTVYYKGGELTDAKSRFDIEASTVEYDIESKKIGNRVFNRVFYPESEIKRLMKGGQQ